MPAPLTYFASPPRQLSRLHVDRTFPGRIEGVSLLTTGPALGHGFEVDLRTVERVVELGEGIRGRWTHGEPSEDALARHLGHWTRLRAEPCRLCRACGVELETDRCSGCDGDAERAWRAVGDFHFAESAWQVRPDGLSVPAPEYLMARAEEDPRSLGVSIVARLHVPRPPKSGARLARILSDTDLVRADFVADPAANPTGLAAQPGGGFDGYLDQLVANEGAPAAKLRVLGELARYFGDEGEPEGNLLARDVVRLQAQVEELSRQVRRLDRVAIQQSEGLVERLRRESTELGAPIDGADLRAVQTLLDAGSTQSAEVLGQALLAAAQGKAQAPYAPPPPPPPSTASSGAASGSLAAQALVLRAAGHDALAASLTPPSTPA